MKATNLDLIGENKWGQTVSMRMYSDDFGQKYVSVPQIGSLRRKMVPYRQFANDALTFSYIMERKACIGRQTW